MNADKHTGKLNAHTDTLERSIVLQVKKKLPHEKPEKFRHEDDAELVTFRRKLARWADDNINAIKTAQPEMPTGVDGRLENDWCTIIAIADMAGGDFPERARTALVNLTPHTEYNASLRLLEATYWLFVGEKPEGEMPTQITVKRTKLASAFIVKRLNANKMGEWCEFDGRGRPITQRGVARLFRPYDIQPGTVHPTGSAKDSPKGYELADFADAFTRYLPYLPPLVPPLKSKKAAAKKGKGATVKRHRHR
jgi:putative DNA primase/helicase